MKPFEARFHLICVFYMNLCYPIKFKRPNLLDEPDPNEATGNQGIIGQLKIAGDFASQRATTHERLQWGSKILDGLVTAGEIASGVCARRLSVSKQ